jgi:hypothetical protein
MTNYSPAQEHGAKLSVKTIAKQKIMKHILIVIFFMLLGVNTFTQHEDKYNLDFDRCTVVNESTTTLSKFEIDLTCCGMDSIYQKPQNPDINRFLWLSVTSENITELTEGVYRFSSDKINERKPMTFSGELRKNNMTLKITRGIVLIYKYEDKIKVLYQLTFMDGNKMKGGFFGEYNLFSME